MDARAKTIVQVVGYAVLVLLILVLGIRLGRVSRDATGFREQFEGAIATAETAEQRSIDLADSLQQSEDIATAAVAELASSRERERRLAQQLTASERDRGRVEAELDRLGELDQEFAGTVVEGAGGVERAIEHNRRAAAIVDRLIQEHTGAVVDK